MVDGKLVLLVGRSASGKDTMLDILKEDYGVDGIVSCTSRPPRHYETEGVQYHFLNHDEFMNLVADGYFIEHKEYVGWYYGTPWVSVQSKGNKFSIIEPKGLEQFIEILGRNKIVVVFVEVESEVRLNRLCSRRDNPEEAIRRLRDDNAREDFKYWFTNADFTIYNNEDDYEMFKEHVKFFFEEVLAPCLGLSEDLLGVSELVFDTNASIVEEHLGVDMLLP